MNLRSGCLVELGKEARDVVRIGGLGQSVTVGMAGVADRPAEVSGSTATFRDVQPGVDLEYRVGNTLVKETLLLDAEPVPGQASWRFPLTFDPGLTPTLTPTGAVSVTDPAGVEVFQVPAPLMWDSNSDPLSGDPGAYGPAGLTVEGDATNGWTLVVTADEVWLADRSRVYPVHVDPTWNWSAPRDDAFVASSFPNSNYNVAWNSTYGMYEDRVGRYSATWGEGRTYLHYDLSPVRGSQVFGAWWSGYFFHTYTVAPTWFRFQHLNCGFGTTTVTWNAQPCWGGAYADGSVGRGQWATLDVTGIVANQASGAWPDAGYVVHAGTAIGDFKRLAATENSNGAAPVLEVDFNRPPSQATPYCCATPGNGWQYHTQNLALSGLASDPDGDPIQYYYRLALGADAETGVVWQQPWTTATQVTIPPSVIPYNQTYYWHVYTHDGYWQTNPNWVWWFRPVNGPPAAANMGASSPRQDEVIGSLTPALSVPAATDPDADVVKYWFRVATGSDGQSGQVVSSGWLTTPSRTVPSGVLKDGVPYTWMVTTTDDLQNWDGKFQVDSTVGRFKVDLRLGLAKTVPQDAVGPVAVNLFNGNAVVSASSPNVATVGGNVGVSFTYNSAKRPEQGLVGSYFDGIGNRDFPTGESAELVRLDPQVTFDWAAGSPFAPAIGVDGFRIRWSGFVTVVTTGSYTFGAVHDDGVRIKVDGTTVLDKWIDTPGLTDFGSAKTLTAGQTVPIVVEFFENAGMAQLRVRGPDGEFEVPASWLSPNPPALPAGWELSADLDGDGGYLYATVTDTAVTLTDASGSTHTYSKKSDESFLPPLGEEGTLSKDGDGNLVLVDSDGRSFRFNPAGQVIAASWPADDRKTGVGELHLVGNPGAADRDHGSGVGPDG